jgi:hypothetical protein
LLMFIYAYTSFWFHFHSFLLLISPFLFQFAFPLSLCLYLIHSSVIPLVSFSFLSTSTRFSLFPSFHPPSFCYISSVHSVYTSAAICHILPHSIPVLTRASEYSRS